MYSLEDKPADKKSTTVSGGVGFLGLLQIAFIILKLCGVITWAWPVVLLPIIIEGGLFILAVIILVIAAIIKR